MKINRLETILPDSALVGGYVSPEVAVVFIHSEGVLCSSVQGIEHEDFTLGGEFDL